MTKQPSRVGVEEMPETAGMSRTFTWGGGGGLNRQGERTKSDADDRRDRSAEG